MSHTEFSPLETHTEHDINSFSELLHDSDVFKRLQHLLVGGVTPSSMDNKILNHLTKIPSWLEYLVALPYPQYQFSIVLEQWLSAYRKYSLALDQRLAQTCTNPCAYAFTEVNGLLCLFLVELRKLLCSNVHRKRQYFNQREATNNYNSCCAYIDSLFECYARLVVIRLDFSYKAFASFTTFEQAQEHLKQLRNNTRHCNLFDGLEGYIAKIEYGLEKQIHIHTLFFFNAHKRKGSSDVYLAQGIGEYWVNTVTKGTGAYWNCNDSKEIRYKQRVGIGLIEACDTTKRENLLVVVRYLCKKDTQVIKPRYQPQTNTLFKGDLRNHNPNLGRPRSYRTDGGTAKGLKTHL